MEQIEDLNFHLDAFEGPLDLLLHLISKNKVDICDIPIALILDQYMEYINKWQSMNMDVAGEFIAMASELMLIKSKMLLPKPQIEQEDPRERLAQALIEYKRSKEFAVVLNERFKDYHGRLIKDPEVIEKDVILVDHDVSLLYSAFQRIVTRARANSEELLSQSEEKTLGNLLTNVKKYSLTEKISDVLTTIESKDETKFTELFDNVESRGELVTIFIAILELLRTQLISISSDEEESNTFDIMLKRNSEVSKETLSEDLEDY